jgi:hypothetical protein
MSTRVSELVDPGGWIFLRVVNCGARRILLMDQLSGVSGRHLIEFMAGVPWELEASFGLDD